MDYLLDGKNSRKVPVIPKKKSPKKPVSKAKKSK